MNILVQVCCPVIMIQGHQFEIADYTDVGEDHCLYEKFDTPSSRYAFPEGCSF